MSGIVSLVNDPLSTLLARGTWQMSKIEEAQFYVAEAEKHVSALKQHIHDLEAAGGSTARPRVLLAEFEALLEVKLKILRTLQATMEISPKQDD